MKISMGKKVLPIQSDDKNIEELLQSILNQDEESYEVLNEDLDDRNLDKKKKRKRGRGGKN